MSDTDKKLTDNEIIKALEGMIQFANTVDRSVLDMVDVKTLKNILDLINRLKEQIKAGDKIYEDTCNKFDIDLKIVNEKLKTAKAENENYSKNNRQMTSDILKLYKDLEQAKAENKILQNFKAYFDFYYGSDIEILGIDENGDTTSFDEFYNCAIANAESIEHHIAHIIKTAKAEAYKEFAERLNKETFKIDYCGSIYNVVDKDDIDNLLKELVGRDNASKN